MRPNALNPARVYKTEAIILRHRRMGEADKVLTLFTPNYGKIEVIAKGARRPKSRKTGHLEILSRSTLLLARGRNLDVVTQSEGAESLVTLREDLERLSQAIYVAELVDRFSAERVENYPLYLLLLDTLRRLSGADPIELTLRFFELRLLSNAGFQPQLHECAACGQSLTPVVNYFSAAIGGCVCSACRLREGKARPLTVNALKVMRLFQSGSFGDASRLRLTASLNNEIEEHLRLYIRHVLEREVRSLEFVQTVRHTPSLGQGGERISAG